MCSRVNANRIRMGRLPAGADVLSALNTVCHDEDITAGYFLLIGAVSRAQVLYYHQKKHQYTPIRVPQKPLEIASCTGNISLMDGRIFIHAHIVLSDSNGKTYGGHLAEGTTVFAAEYCIHELCGAQHHRIKDIPTGLNLWADVPKSSAKKPF